MSVDLACAEAAFVDLTFVGLERLPRLGEERHARDFVRSAGGAAITAIGAARLGLDVALCSPLGADAEGAFVRDELRAAGVHWAGREIERTAVTVVLPADGERAMATYDPCAEVTAAELAAVKPRVALVGWRHVALAPPGARVYVSLGDAEARAGLQLAALDGAHSLLVNEREAALLTTRAHPDEAARALGEHVECAVITCGPEGAVAVHGGQLVRVAGVPADAVDTTGAGDLFCSAYAWSDALGLALEERLEWAVLYAALSVEVPTGVAGALTRDALVRAGEARGLEVPAAARPMSMTRRRNP